MTDATTDRRSALKLIGAGALAVPAFAPQHEDVGDGENGFAAHPRTWLPAVLNRRERR